MQSVLAVASLSVIVAPAKADGNQYVNEVFFNSRHDRPYHGALVTKYPKKCKRK